MKKHYFVVSDIEMGKGDVMDDFTDDDHLVEFIQSIIGNGNDQTFLVLNGDIFDFLKMDFKGEYPRYITEEVSFWKLEQILKAHPKIFKALGEFVKNENHHLHFVIGNHDLDLVWPKVQQHLRSELGEDKKIYFDFKVEDEDMHIQHGHSLDPFFEHDIAHPIVTFKGQKILNLPIGSQIVFSYITPLKRQFPKEDQFYPRTHSAEKYPEYHRAMNRIKWINVWKVAYYRVRYFYDPTYRVNAKGFLKHLFKFGFNFIDDTRFLPSRLKELARIYPNKKLFVLGHTHISSEVEEGNNRFLITDTWRDEFNILLAERPKKKKTYAEIIYEDGHRKFAGIKVFVPSLKNLIPTEKVLAENLAFGSENRVVGVE